MEVDWIGLDLIESDSRNVIAIQFDWAQFGLSSIGLDSNLLELNQDLFGRAKSNPTLILIEEILVQSNVPMAWIRSNWIGPQLAAELENSIQFKFDWIGFQMIWKFQLHWNFINRDLIRSNPNPTHLK